MRNLEVRDNTIVVNSHSSAPLRRSILLEMLLAGAAVCLGFGVSLPVVKLTWLYFWSDTHSILSVLWYLFQEGEIFLSGLLFTFSVLFPIIKLCFILGIYIHHLMGRYPRVRALRYLAWFGKWSMLDVLVLALVVFYAKQSGVADAITRPGIYFFTASVLMTMWASGLLEQLLAGNKPEPVARPDRIDQKKIQ